MPVLRHISLDDEHVQKMKPYLEKHEGNLCAALREIINESGKYASRTKSTVVDNVMLDWMLREVEGMFVPDDALDALLDPALMASMAALERSIKQKIDEFGWDVDVVFKYDSETYPSEVLLEMRGSLQKTKFMASLISRFIVRNSLARSPLEIKFVLNINSCIKIGFFRSNEKDALKSLIRFFGGLDEEIKIIRKNPDFWKDIINRHLLSNYNMVTIHRNYFEDLFAERIPASEIIIETIAKRPVADIPLKEMLVFIKEAFESSRIVDRVDIDYDTIIVSHNYRNEAAVERVKQSLVMLLESNGHLYDARSTANMLVLRHRPDVGIKINEIVDRLKSSGSTVDRELLLFTAFLEGLRDIPDIPNSLTALGRRLGKSLLKEYERENGIDKWDLVNFKKAMDTIDSRLHRVSEWKMGDRQLIYTIRKCHIAETGNTFDSYICHTAREVFRGVLEQAFGSRAELKINKLISHGDNFCEVLIRVP